MALKMRAIPFMKACEAHELVIKEWPRPVPKPNEVLIKVKAFGLNFAEIVARKGQYQDAPPFPFVAGYEVSGTIEDLGDQVQGFEKGQKVFAFCDFGGYAEYCAVRQEAVFPLPDSLTFSQGASLPVQFATAYHCLHETGQLREGTRVLIHAAAGGVGLAAVQLCRIAGAEIIGTCGSEEKVGILREWGVNHPINYTVSDYSVEVQKLFPDGVDVILNSLGGDTIKKDLALLRAGGRVVGYGGADMTDRSFFKAFALIPKVLSMLTLNSIDLLMNSRSFCGVNMKRVGDQRPDLLRLDMLAVVKLLEEGKLKTIISQELPWDKLGHAQGLMENRKTTGKIVLVIPDEEEAAAAAPVEEEGKGKADQEESGPSSQPEEASE